jgi:hypothetical protein
VEFGPQSGSGHKPTVPCRRCSIHYITGGWAESRPPVTPCCDFKLEQGRSEGMLFDAPAGMGF